MKKVFMVTQAEKRHVKDKLFGGIQACERMQLSLLTAAGYEVHASVCSDSDADLIDHPNFHGHQLSARSEDWHEEHVGLLDKQVKSRLNKQKVKDNEELIRLIQPNVIINHSFSAAQIALSARLASTVPTLCWLHDLPENFMDMSFFSKLTSYLKLIAAGSLVINVSHFQVDRWRTYLKRRVTAGNVGFTGVLNDQLIEQVFDRIWSPYISFEPKAQAPASYFIGVGRADPAKNFHTLLGLWSELVDPPKLKLFMAYSGVLDNNEYYVDKLKPLLAKLGDKVELRMNAPRAEVLAGFASAVGSLNPYPLETLCIAGLESANYGAPCLALARSFDGTSALRHALTEAIAPDQVTVVPTRGNHVAELQRFLDEAASLTLGERDQLAQLVHAKYKRELKLAQLQELIESLPAARWSTGMLEF